MKYLLLLLFIVVIALAWRHRARRGASATADERPVEEIVACAHCGLHLPRGEALGDGPLFFCSEAHRQAGARRP